MATGGTKSVIVRQIPDQLPATLDDAHARIRALEAENDTLRRRTEAQNAVSLHGLEQPLLGATSLQQQDADEACCACFHRNPTGFFQERRRRGSTNTIVQRKKSDAKDAQAGISAMGLVAVGFFWVSGGSYGNEALVLAAPPGDLFFGIVVIGLSYGIPLALITAELGTGWPVAGGMAQWVEIALGEVLGAHNAWWIWVCYVFDCAIYPVLAAHYLSKYTEVTFFQEKTYATFVVFVMTLVKLGGREVLEKMSTVLGQPMHNIPENILNRVVTKSIQADLRKYKMGTNAERQVRQRTRSPEKREPRVMSPNANRSSSASRGFAPVPASEAARYEAQLNDMRRAITEKDFENEKLRTTMHEMIEEYSNQLAIRDDKIRKLEQDQYMYADQYKNEAIVLREKLGGL